MSDDKVTFTLNRVVSALNHRADNILREEFELTYSQFLFLVTLQPGQCTVTQLANRLDISVAGVSKKLDWFVERGYVRTAEDPSNARKVIVELSSKGKRLAQQTSEALERHFVELFADFRGLDFERLNQDLHTVLNHLNANTRIRL